jgi:site-specific recombinase XerD
VGAALKSLFGFAQETGFLRFNVGKAVKSPSVKNTLAERIMPEADMLRLIGMETKPRNRAILTLLYGGGLRISELCGLCWRDLAERQGGEGQATIYGKGGKTRAVLLSANTWRTLMSLRGEAGPDEPVFRSREGGALDPTQVRRIVKAAARRAGLPEAISPHWFRHAHGSHSLDRGAPIHLVQAMLGHASVVTTGCACIQSANTMALFPLSMTLPSRWHRTARARTRRSMSRPLRMRSSGVSRCETRSTSCSIIGPSSRSLVT